MNPLLGPYAEDDLADLASRDDVLGALRGVRDELKEMIVAAKTELAMAVADALDERIDSRVGLALEQYREELGVARGCFELAMARLESVIRALPVPQVNVAAPSVTVEVPRHKVTKKITYGPDGRPEAITEQEG